MLSDYYLVISYNDDYSIYGLGIYDRKEQRNYCGDYVIGKAYDDYKSDLILKTEKNKLCLQINKKQFLKFKKIHFHLQIKNKNLTEILITLGLEEYAI